MIDVLSKSLPGRPWRKKPYENSSPVQDMILSKKQKKFAALSYPLWAACEGSAFLMGKKFLSPRENTRRCYEDFFDPLCGKTGVWPDYTEGYYPENNEKYEQAKQKQFDYILDKCGATSGSEILEIGCGNGKLALKAIDRGCKVSGVTVSREQAAVCRHSGIDVRVCSFDALCEEFSENRFDTIILNGPSEHFVTEEQALSGESQRIRESLFDICQKLLKPGGRIFITCIHFRYDADIKEVIKYPLRHKPGSYNFQMSVLVRLYSGWYPEPGTYEQIAQKYGLKKILDRDATYDYLLTSLNWSKRLKSYLKKTRILPEIFLKNCS